ncbi:hypothetical protein AAHH80_37845, partial [Burkholderia pseudomallei]
TNINNSNPPDKLFTKPKPDTVFKRQTLNNIKTCDTYTTTKTTHSNSIATPAQMTKIFVSVSRKPKMTTEHRSKDLFGTGV